MKRVHSVSQREIDPIFQRQPQQPPLFDERKRFASIGPRAPADLDFDEADRKSVV